MKYSLYFLILIGLLTSCGGSKNIATTSPVPVTVIEEKVIITEVPEMTPEVETQIIEAPELPSETIENPTTDIETPESEKLEPVVAYFDHGTFNQLLFKNVSLAGNVNYDAIKRDWKSLRAYIKALGQNIPTDSWSTNDKLAYWMNAYNAMTVDLILRNYPLSSIKDIKDPWDQRLWKLGDKWYNLNEIEHQILRKMGDPRIHFGINCASFSCPPLLNEAFTAQDVDAQLDKLSRTFVNDTQRNTITTNSIEVSKIFTWFAKDFKTNGSLIDFLNKYSDTPISQKAKKRYKEYDWTLNN
ncbi:MAG: DUF547 domain-containing protein [Dokdonia sp.]|nr:DUF547 domain-containing protein [Dokdonia sp.]